MVVQWRTAKTLFHKHHEVLVPPVASSARRWCSCVLWGCSLTGVSFHFEVKPFKLTVDDCCLSGDTLANIFGDQRIDCPYIEACWPEDGYLWELFFLLNSKPPFGTDSLLAFLISSFHIFDQKPLFVCFIHLHTPASHLHKGRLWLFHGFGHFKKDNVTKGKIRKNWELSRKEERRDGETQDGRKEEWHREMEETTVWRERERKEKRDRERGGSWQKGRGWSKQDCRHTVTDATVRGRRERRL